MFSLLAFIIILVLGRAIVVETRYAPTGANCAEYNIPVKVLTTGVNFVAAKWFDDYQLTDFVTIAATRSSANVSSPIGESIELKGEYTISGTFCSPKSKNEHSSTVLLATHGLGFDRSYWNSPYKPETYNFAQYVTGKGYSIFFYDRLGTGKSSVGQISGFVNQAAIQQQILHYLATQIRAGCYTDSIGEPKKLVLVGHSFGSFISHGLIAKSPEIADGVILTGLAFAMNSAVSIEAFVLRVAAQQDNKFSDRDDGYVTWADVYANINNFFKAPYYSEDATAFAEETKQPFAITELLSINTIAFGAQSFTGPVLILNGEFDFIVCQGLCSPAVNNQPAATLFSGSQSFRALTQPGTGHGLNYHKNATGGYQIITDYLTEQKI